MPRKKKKEKTAFWFHFYLRRGLLFPPTRTRALFETNVNAFSDRTPGCRDQLRPYYLSDAKYTGIKIKITRGAK
jgi:hypothetical protein